MSVILHWIHTFVRRLLHLHIIAGEDETVDPLHSLIGRSWLQSGDGVRGERVWHDTDAILLLARATERVFFCQATRLLRPFDTLLPLYDATTELLQINTECLQNLVLQLRRRHFGPVFE